MLAATLSAEPAGDALNLALRVENGGESPVELRFRSGQRADFAAEQDGEEVWRWSRGRMFTQALGTETFRPGETRTFEAAWRDPPAGEYTVRGWLTADGADASAETGVVI